MFRTHALPTLTAASLAVALTGATAATAAPADDRTPAPLSGDGATMGWSVPDEHTTGQVGTMQAQDTSWLAELTHGPYGVDTSGHTTIEDWQWFTDHSAKFAWIKATEGNYMTADSFSEQWSGATEQGMLRGSYHFANPEFSSGPEQAEFFVENRGGWSGDGRTLPGALDLEYNPYGEMCYGKTKAEMNSWARGFITRYEQLTGVKPIIYTNADWWNTCVGDYDYSDVKLWLARYADSPGKAPHSWSHHGAAHTIWQTHPVDAHGYDVNRVRGSFGDLKQLARKG
ncbi:GH25 family lysozyme [Kytococcus sp. Marseille-QA3725]